MSVVSLFASAASHAGGSGLMAMIMGMMAMIQGASLLITVIMVASFWKLFEKAGEPPWHALIPFLNILTMCKVLNKSPLLILLVFVPCIGWIALKLIFDFALAERYGQSAGFAIGLILLPYIFMPILAFGSSTYQRP